MLRKLLATMSVLALAAGASADISFGWAAVDNYVDPAGTDLAVDIEAFNAAGYVTYDLVMDVGAETWTTEYSLATLTDATFFNHPLGELHEMAPDPGSFAEYAVLAFDSFYTGMNDYPNAPAYGDARGHWAQNTPTVREIEYYDYPPLDSTGQFVTARFTFLPTSDDWVLCVVGLVTTLEGGPDTTPFTTCIPEPGSLPLLALGGLALIRRR